MLPECRPRWTIARENRALFFVVTFNHGFNVMRVTHLTPLTLLVVFVSIPRLFSITAPPYGCVCVCVYLLVLKG